MTQGYNWDNLNPRNLDRCAEYFVKMEFTRHGLRTSNGSEHAVTAPHV